MGKYVRYERMEDELSPDEINEKLKWLTTEGWEIVHYNEEPIGILDGVEKIRITMLCGKINEGNKQFLNS